MAVTSEGIKLALQAVRFAAMLALLLKGSSAEMCDANSPDQDSTNCNTGMDGSGTGSYGTVFESLSASHVPVASGLSYDFYDNSCPNFRSIIKQVVSDALQADPTTAAAITRVFFHDCFIQGCDGSLLLTGPGSEQLSTPNLNLKPKAFQLVDAIKTKLEQACPNTVSCADILSLGAAEAIQQVNGPTIFVPVGRRDGTTFAPNQTVFFGLPSPLSNVSVNFLLFSNQGFSYTDFVALSGAHTLGTAKCASFFNRLHPMVDFDLDSKLASTLEQLCPQATTNAEYVLDDTPNNFDNNYYKQVLCGEVLLTSDASLELDSNTGYLVRQYARSQSQFSSQFGNSFLKMSQLGVLTGSAGEIRKTCSSANYQ